MNYGCKDGLPHEIETARDKDGRLLDFSNVLYEICIRCGKKFRWNKDVRGRISSKEYLAAHIREFAQPGGRTGKTFEKLYGKPKDPRKKGTNNPHA